jgi:hypothetical protein
MSSIWKAHKALGIHNLVRNFGWRLDRKVDFFGIPNYILFGNMQESWIIFLNPLI